jgi:hypothetical protein
MNLFDTGSGIRDGKIRIRDKHSGCATLKETVPEFYFINSLDCGEYVKDLQAGGIPDCQSEDKKTNNELPI